MSREVLFPSSVKGDTTMESFSVRDGALLFAFPSDDSPSVDFEDVIFPFGEKSPNLRGDILSLFGDVDDTFGKGDKKGDTANDGDRSKWSSHPLIIPWISMFPNIEGHSIWIS